MTVVVTMKYILTQLINFCVPLIIIGFIAPSITQMGNNATRLLAVAVTAAYLSSVLAAFMSMGAGYAIIPYLNIAANTKDLRGLPEIAFQLDIPQIMPVMASLGLITGALGFGSDATALMLAVFALQDSFGTACNVTGDGTLTLILTGYAEKHGIQEEKAEGG